jgi:hypothetical protein
VGTRQDPLKAGADLSMMRAQFENERAVLDAWQLRTDFHFSNDLLTGAPQ